MSTPERFPLENDEERLRPMREALYKMTLPELVEEVIKTRVQLDKLELLTIHRNSGDAFDPRH